MEAASTEVMPESKRSRLDKDKVGRAFQKQRKHTEDVSWGKHEGFIDQESC